MRLQLKRVRVAAALVTVLASPLVRAEDRATVRGAYYREASTKVVQPMVLVSKDLPDGFDVAAHGLVDAITSPSVLTGVAGDNIFTEYRKEAGMIVGKTIDRTRLALSYRQSREPDYISHSAGLQVLAGVWENSGTAALSLAYSHDTIGPNLNNPLDVGFASLAYVQALSPLLLAEARYELTYQNGYLCNAYDQDARGRAKCPRQRARHVGVLRVAHYVPALAGGAQLHYRVYYDQQWGASTNPWGMAAHSAEVRLYKEASRTLELRLSYRFHTQTAAAFWWCNGDPSRAANPECGGDVLSYHASLQTLGPLRTQFIELQFVWAARALALVPLLAWFADGTFELSYGHYFQTTHYGNAHVLQTGYSLPF